MAFVDWAWIGLIAVGCLWWAGVLGWRRQSISWRGTVDPARALVEGSRMLRLG